LATANITIQVDSDFVHKLAEAIVRKQLGGETVKPPDTAADTWPPAPPDDDPWSTPGPGPANSPAATTAPPADAPAPPVGPSVEIVQTPKGPQTWTLNLPAAPRCLCGQAAAHIQGTTNGRTWARYGCAKAKDKSTYRSKCDFSEWA
jgi:hypothetical protein